MKHGSLFSGIGGFDLAAEWMGWENVFHCEWNPFGKKVLKYYWPNAISYDDITKTDFTIHRGTIDILTGGFPCQPYSSARKRKGTEDARHLWPEMLRAIREIQPRYVVGENVRGLTNWNGGLVFDQVQADLEDEGFEVLPFLLPACAVNAPHRRDRIWFIAHSQNIRCGNTKEIGREREKYKSYNGSSIRCTPNEFSTGGITSNSYENGHNRQREGEFRGCNSEPSADPAGLRQSRKEHRQAESGWFAETSLRNDWKNFPTQSPICSRNDGIPAGLVGITFPKFRNESIAAYGNAIVPQVAYQIFKAIEQTDSHL